MQKKLIMKRFFVTNLIFLLTLNILIKSFWILGIDRGVQNVLPASSYGIYYALLNFTFLFNILLDLGITQFNNRTIAQNPILLKKYFAKIIPLKVLLAFCYIIILFVIAYILNYDSFAFHLLRWLVVFQILTSILAYLRSNISSLLLFKTDSFLSVLDKFLTIIFCSLMLYTPILNGKMKIDYFVYAQVLSMFLSVLIALIICIHKTGFIKINIDTRFMFIILKKGFPYALLILLMSFYNRMDTVMIERILHDGSVQSSIYASAFRLVDSVNMIAYLFSVILLPLFAKIIKDRGNIQEIIKISFHFLLIISIGFVALSLLCSNELMSLLYNKHISESTEVFRVLCFCFIPISMTYIFGTLLTANGSLRKLNIVAFIGMLINIIVNLILIPRYKALGSAYSALTAQTLTAILQIIISLKVFHIKLSYNYIVKISAFISSILLMSWIISNMSWIWYYKGISILVIIVVISFFFRIFSLREIFNYSINIIKSKKS